MLDDGIAPGLDMVIVDLDSPAISAAGGIWQGMSGSPVYAGDGRLIGAVAYGLAYGPSPIAGVTPFEDMDDYLAAPPGPAKADIDRDTAQQIAAASDVTAAQAQQGFEPLGVATGVSGVGASRLAKLTPAKRAYFPKGAYAAGRASPGPRRSTTWSRAATSPRRTPTATSRSAASGPRRRSATTRSSASVTRWTSWVRRR